MNIDQAIKKLKDKGYSVTVATLDAKLEAARNAKSNKNCWPLRTKSEEQVRQNFRKTIYNVGGSLFTERKLIKFAKGARQVGNQNLKNFSKRTRAAERDALKTEEFDKIPQNGPVKDI